MKLPKIIHQIWIGPDEMPDYCKQYTTEMENMHPDWEYRLWDNDMVFDGQFKNDPYLKDWKDKINSEYMLQPAFISDRVRLLILKEMGGIYVDVDALPIRPFDTILNQIHSNANFFAGVRTNSEHGNLIDVTILGAEPNSRVINKILENNHFPMSGLHMSKDFFKYLDTDMCLFGPDYFYRVSGINEKTVILHDAGRLMSWSRSGLKPPWDH